MMRGNPSVTRLCVGALIAGLLPLAVVTCSSKDPNVDSLMSGSVPDAQPRDTGGGNSQKDAKADSSDADANGMGTMGGSDGGCDAGQMVCGNACTNVMTDPNNCGQCRNQCGMSFICSGGSCVCTPTQTLCNNTCVDINTDPNNCGACGHACQGNPCAAGLCLATVVASATGTSIANIAVDSRNIYWTQMGSGGSAGGLSMKAFAAAAPVIPLTGDPNLGDPRGIAVDQANVYWADYTTGFVEAASLVDFRAAAIYGVPTPDGGPAPDGGTGTSHAFDVAVDGTNVYWVTLDGNVAFEPIGGGPVTTISNVEVRPRAIAVSGTNVFWVNQGGTSGSTGSIRQASLADGGVLADGGAPITIAANESSPWAIAVDATSIYWTNQVNTQGTVKKAPIGGGTVVTLATGLGDPYGIVVDSDYVYWTNYDNGTVTRLPKAGGDGGAPFTLAAGQNTPGAMAIDLSNIYWVAVGSGNIFKVAK